jgi:hypothetical protein
MFRFDINTTHADDILFEDNNRIILNFLTVPNNKEKLIELIKEKVDSKKIYLMKPMERFGSYDWVDDRVFIIGNEIYKDTPSFLLHLKCYIDCFFPDLDLIIHSDKKFSLSYMAHRFQPERFEFFKLIHKNLKDDFLVAFSNVREYVHHESVSEIKDGIQLPFHQNSKLQIQKYFVKYDKPEAARRAHMDNPQPSVQVFYEDAVRLQSQGLINIYFETDFNHYGISEKSIMPLISKTIPLPITKSKEVIDSLKNAGFNFFFDELGLPEIFDFNNPNAVKIYDDFLKNITFEEIEKIYNNNLDKIENNFNLMVKIAIGEFKF